MQCTTDVVIGSGEPLTGAGLGMAFAGHGDLRPVGPFGSVAGVVDAGLHTERPVAIVDVTLLGSQLVLGVHALARADVRPVLFGGDGVIDELPALLRAGARGYVARNATAVEAVRSVRAVIAGGLGLEEAVQRRITTRLLDLHDAGAPRLSARERAVLRRVAEGETTALIAVAMHLSERTVKTYLARAGEKLGTTTRAAAAVRAERLGLL